MVTALRDRVYDRVRLLGSPGKQVPLVIWQTCQVKPPPNPTRCCHKCCHGSYLETSRASKSKAFLCRISSDLNSLSRNAPICPSLEGYFWESAACASTHMLGRAVVRSSLG